MLVRTQARAIATSQIANAFATKGGVVSSSRAVPMPSGKGPVIAVYAGDRKAGNYGSAPEFKTEVTVSIEVRCEVSSAQGENALKADDGARAAELQLDQICDTIEQTLLGQATFPCTLTWSKENQTFTAMPTTPANNLRAGLLISGNGVDPKAEAWIDTVDANTNLVTIRNAAGPVLLSSNTPDDNYVFTIGSFVSLFEEITTFETFIDDGGFENQNYIASASIEIKGHTHERFEVSSTQSFSGLNIYMDSISVFDPTGDYTGGAKQEPFNAATPPPREEGPDGRPEIEYGIDIPTE